MRVEHAKHRTSRPTYPTAIGALLPIVVACALLGCKPPLPAEASPEQAPSPPDVGRGEPASIGAERSPELVRLGVVGFWGSPTHGEAFEPLADFLAERIGRPVEVMSAERYDDLVDLLSEGLLDLALLPPLVYVRASSKALPPKLIRTMVVNGSIHYSGYVIVRADSPVSRPADLVARRVAFVESSSASGYVFARKWLTSHGLGPESLDATVFAGSHEAVIRAVISGEVDAGATFQGALRSARAVGLDTGVLRVLAITGRIPLDALVAASDLDSDLVAEIDAALGRANTNTAEGRTALSKLPGINGWVRTDDSLYRPLRKVLASSAGEPGGDR